MTANYGAFCTDYYVNVKLGLKLELNRGRETVLALFERVRRQYPAMSEFRRYAEELALESPSRESPHRWIAVRANSVRAGVVNPDRLLDAYRLHETALDVSPYFLDISPLDVEYVEVLWGFDLAAGTGQDAIVAQTLLAGSPLGGLLDAVEGRVADCQPVVGFSLGEGAEAFFEVRTRSESSAPDRSSEPISVYLTVRRTGPVEDLQQLVADFRDLTDRGESLIERGVLPILVKPIRAAIVPGL